MALKISDESEEELEVLKSIFDEEAVYFDDDNASLTIQCICNLPSKTISIFSSIRSRAFGVAESDSNNNDDTYKQDVSYLSPVTLTCALSRGYPEENLSSINVSCVWLCKREVSIAESYLNDLWVEGEPVIYNMVSWIQDSLLEYFNIYDEIHISDSDNEYQFDLLTRISILNKFNQHSLLKHFSFQFHECATCFCEYPGDEMRLLTCSHAYCTLCIATFIKVQYENGKFCEINCSICDVFIGRNSIREFLNVDEFKIWDEKFAEQSVEQDPSVSFCPRCNKYAVREEDSNFGQCLSCNFVFCELCDQAWHPGSCTTFAVPDALQSKPAQVTTEEQLRRESRKKEYMLTQLMMKAFLMQCPKCKCWVMRDYGCNHMSCAICKTSFCYVCGKTPSGHGSGGSICDVAMPDAPIDIKQLNPSQESVLKLVSTRMPELVVSNLVHDVKSPDTTKCVKCLSRIQRLKGNNHANCVVCKTQFCFLCREIVKGTTHFSAASCQQHGSTIKRC